VSVDDPNIIDMVGVESATGKVILTIADHLDWADGDAHQLKLQEKLNTYLAFIESGELSEAYPDAKGRTPVIALAMRVAPSDAGNEFLKELGAIIAGAGIEFSAAVVSE
jgi:hypothetical protein